MRMLRWLSRKLRRNGPTRHPVATPALEKFADQTLVAQAELAQQRVGTNREARVRQRVLNELDLELKLFRLKSGKTR